MLLFEMELKEKLKTFSDTYSLPSKAQIEALLRQLLGLSDDCNITQNKTETERIFSKFIEHFLERSGISSPQGLGLKVDENDPDHIQITKPSEYYEGEGYNGP